MASSMGNATVAPSPRNTVRRELEGMHMLGLLRCEETDEIGSDGKEYTVFRYRLAADYDEKTLRTMADKPAGEEFP